MSRFDEHISNGEDLYGWFHMIHTREQNFKRSTNRLETGICVSTAVRNKVMLSVDAGKITLAGKVHQIEFQNMHGGVWRAHIYIDSGK